MKTYKVDGLHSDVNKRAWKEYNNPNGETIEYQYSARMPDGNDGSGVKVKKADQPNSAQELNKLLGLTKHIVEKKEDNSHWYDGTVFHPDWGGPRNAPLEGGSIGISAEVNNMPTGGIGIEAKAVEGGGSSIQRESGVIQNVLYLSSNPSAVEASAQVTLDLARKKGYSGNNPYTVEGEVSFNMGIVGISLYKNSDGGSGLRISLGVSTTKLRNPVTATVKVKEN